MAMGFSFNYMDSALGAGSDCTDLAVDDFDCSDSLIDNSAASKVAATSDFVALIHCWKAGE